MQQGQQDRAVRRARPGDAWDIAAVHVQAWREAYAHLLPAQTLALLDVEERAARWSRVVDEGITDVWVADGGPDITGWASIRRSDDVDAPRPRVLTGLYVLATHHGNGTGQALLDAAAGDGSAYLWVAADNPRAQAFYGRNGFVLDGARATKPLAAVPVAVVRMVR